jgi:hypothetical protein
MDERDFASLQGTPRRLQVTCFGTPPGSVHDNKEQHDRSQFVKHGEKHVVFICCIPRYDNKRRWSNLVPVNFIVALCA